MSPNHSSAGCGISRMDTSCIPTAPTYKITHLYTLFFMKTNTSPVHSSPLRSGIWGSGSHREPSPWLTVFRGFGAQPWTSHVALAECILAMLYLASERKQNLQVLMIWCLLAHSVATLRPWGCGGHYWISRAGLIPSMTSLRVYLSLTAHCWVTIPGARWRVAPPCTW